MASATRLGFVALGAYLGPAAYLGVKFAASFAIAVDAKNLLCDLPFAEGLTNAAANLLSGWAGEDLRNLFRHFRDQPDRNYHLERAMAQALREALAELAKEEPPEHVKAWFEPWDRILDEAGKSEDALHSLFAGTSAHNAILLADRPDAWWLHLEAALRAWKAQYDNRRANLTQLALTAELPRIEDEAFATRLRERLPSKAEQRFLEQLKQGHAREAATAFQHRLLLFLLHRVGDQHAELRTALEAAAARTEVQLAEGFAAIHAELKRLGEAAAVARGVSAGELNLALTPWQARFRDEPILSERDVLDAAYASIPLIRREENLESALQWLRADAPLSVRTIVGRAGAGKTRFALELLQRVEKELPGWHAGFVDNDHVLDVAPRLDAQRPVLFVFDYAGSQLATIRRLLAYLHKQPGLGRARLLLLDREASTQGGWLKELTSELNTARRSNKAIEEPVRLAALETLEDRRMVLQHALGVFRDYLGRPHHDAMSEYVRGQLAAEGRWQDPLDLMMAAALWSATGRVQALSMSRVELAKSLGARERERIRKYAKPEEEAPLLERLAACVTLVRGGLSEKEATEVAKQEAQELGISAYNVPLLRAHAQAALGGNGGWLSPVTPDILGEALLLEAPGFDDAVVQRVMGHTSAERVLPAVIRTAQNFASPANAEQPADRPADWMKALVERGDRALLLAIERAGNARGEDGSLGFLDPAAPSLALRGVAVRLYERLVELAPAGDAAERARCVNSLAIGQSAAGLRNAALQTMREAVRLYGQLAAAQPETFIPALATSLNNLANAESDAGLRDDALQTAREAVRLRRQLAAAHPDAFLPALAQSLNNLANMESGAGLRDAALQNAREAVRIRRRLTTAHPDAFLPTLARSLNNLANRESEAGLRDASLQSAREAVRICEQLAAKQPDAFLPYLPVSLNNLARIESTAGLRDAALQTAREAVHLYRQLAAAQPDAFLAALAGSLNTLANRESAAGLRDAALATAREAVRLLRQLAAAQPDALLPDLATTLSVLGVCEAAVDHASEALAAYTESIRVLTPYFLKHPDAFAGLMHVTARDYLKACETASQEPDPELLAPILPWFAARAEAAAGGDAEPPQSES